MGMYRTISIRENLSHLRASRSLRAGSEHCECQGVVRGVGERRSNRDRWQLNEGELSARYLSKRFLRASNVGGCGWMMRFVWFAAGRRGLGRGRKVCSPMRRLSVQAEINDDLDLHFY